jgi:hypothetical protein
LDVSDYLAVNGGFLVAYDSGEFGGGLLWFGTASALPQSVSGENTHSILRTSQEILAITGLSHMGRNAGRVLRLEYVGSSWRVASVVALPGAPGATLSDSDGTVMIVAGPDLVRLKPRSRSSEVVHHGKWKGLYPSSIVRDASGAIYIGMHYAVVRLVPNGRRYAEEWLVPSKALPKRGVPANSAL